MGRRKHTDIVVRGVVYADVGAAAEGEGVTKDAVWRAIAAKRLDKLGTRKKKLRVDAMPVRIRDRTFPSVAAAAKHFGVGRSAIYQALARGRIDRVGLRREGGAGSIPVVIGGLRFASMAQASRELGFSAGYVSNTLAGGSKEARQRLIGAAMALRARRDAPAVRAAARRAAKGEERSASC